MGNFPQGDQFFIVLVCQSNIADGFIQFRGKTFLVSLSEVKSQKVLYLPGLTLASVVTCTGVCCDLGIAAMTSLLKLPAFSEVTKA